MKSKKAALELSMNFIVGMIFGIVLFSLGLVFVYRIVADTDKIIDWGLPSTFDVLVKDCVNNNHKVCIPIKKAELRTREHTTFGVIINNNYGQEKDFKIFVKFATGMLEDGTTVSSSSIDLSKWTFTDFKVEKIENNNYEIVNVPFLVPKGTKAGEYVFNINVCFNAIDNQQPSKCSSPYNSLYDTTEQITITVI